MDVAKLTWKGRSGDDLEEFTLFRGATVSLGRGNYNDIVLIDVKTSRRHANISWQEGVFTITDLDSSNGTFVNEIQITTPAPLQSGDQIKLGDTIFTFTPGASLDEFMETRMIEPSALDVIEETAEVQEWRAEAEAIIRLDNLVKDYESPAGMVHVLKDLNLRIQPGEFVGLRGPSGCGKSTLLNMLTGIDRPTSGNVFVAGQSLGKLDENQMARWRGKNIGVIFQFFQLLPTLSIIENVMLPMAFCRMWRPRERSKRAMMLLEQVELADQAYKLPSKLSGGQQQRAAIARALANDPPLVVGDEPTGNLDTKTADLVFALFENLVAQGKTFFMVTHDIGLATRIPRVIEMLDGELREDGSKPKP